MEIRHHWLEVLLALFGFLKVGFCLRCWECNSAIDVTCKDYFNTTRLKENRQYHQNYLNSQISHIQPVIKEPHLATCEYKQSVPHDYKYICLKNIIRDHSKGDYYVKRECRMVPMDFKEGNCPEEIKRQTDTYYCTTCQQDGCNSGEKLKFHVMSAILVAVMMFA